MFQQEGWHFELEDPIEPLFALSFVRNVMDISIAAYDPRGIIGRNALAITFLTKLSANSGSMPEDPPVQSAIPFVETQRGLAWGKCFGIF